MFHAGVISGLALVALPLLIAGTAFGQLGCRLLGVPTNGPIFRGQPSLAGVLAFKAMANSYKLIPCLPIVGLVGFVIGV